MVSRCWKDVNEHLSDENFMYNLTLGVKDVPRHVAFLYCGQKMLAASSNCNNRHAEENVVCKFRNMRDLSANKPYRLVVLKINGQHSMSRPCADCSRFIAHGCPRARVYYTNYEGTLVEDTKLDNTHKSLRKTGRKTKMPLRTCQECD